MIILRGLLGAAIWIAMIAQNLLLSLVSIAVTAVLFIFWALWLPAGRRGAILGTVWRVGLVALLQPFASLVMPVLIAFWYRLPPSLAYALNTPDDQDPATQGWNGNNKEAQVIWVRDHCGAFWTRVYWLERNCLYGLNVALRPWHLDAKHAGFIYDGKWLAGVQAGGVPIAWCRRFSLFGGWRNLWFGAWLPAYLRALGPPCVVSPDSDPNFETDTGGVPALKFKKEMA